jgi:apolipoprotein N-acyltransferase
MIAAVQTNVPQSVKQSFAAEEQILEELLEQSRQAVGAGAKLVIWPETMVQAILEPRILGLLDEEHLYKNFDKAIKEHAGQGAFVLVGAYGGSPRFAESGEIEMAEKFNAAFLYRPDGSQSPQKYYKIHLVPFGEFIPFSNIPPVHKMFLKFSPYDFDYTIDPGKEFTAFEMQTADSNETYRFGTIICYEDAVGGLVRRFVLDREGNKRNDWLVNISNDGWFVRFKDRRLSASTELAQHTVICAFRAIENRLAVLRSVNTGISCMIDTLGQVKDGFKEGNLPGKAFERQGVAGWFADEVPVDSRTTVFSRYGRWLDLSCQLCFGAIIIAMLIERFVIRKTPPRADKGERK